MPGVLKISEATSLALHAMAYLAVNGGGRSVSAREISGAFSVSEAHLSKVFQRLARVGLVETQRGPGGGMRMARDPEDITLLEIYEAIEGPLSKNTCLLGRPACGDGGCVLGDLVEKVNRQVGDYLGGTTLARVADRTGRVLHENHA